MSHQTNNDDLLTKESLSDAQKDNLDFVENFTSQTKTLCGIPVLKALSYEFIQIVNNMYLKNIIGDEEAEEKPEEKEELQS